ncbi:hypothetical protein [Actinotignum sp. GS-2025a]
MTTVQFPALVCCEVICAAGSKSGGTMPQWGVTVRESSGTVRWPRGTVR